MVMEKSWKKSVASVGTWGGGGGGGYRTFRREE